MRGRGSWGLPVRLDELLGAAHLVFHLEEPMVGIGLLLPGLRWPQVHVLKSEGSGHPLLHDFVLDVATLSHEANDGGGDAA